MKIKASRDTSIQSAVYIPYRSYNASEHRALSLTKAFKRKPRTPHLEPALFPLTPGPKAEKTGKIKEDLSLYGRGVPLTTIKAEKQKVPCRLVSSARGSGPSFLFRRFLFRVLLELKRAFITSPSISFPPKVAQTSTARRPPLFPFQTLQLRSLLPPPPQALLIGK